MLELIYSYWLEEGMLVQTMNAVAMRFQNVRSPGEQDPLRHDGDRSIASAKQPAMGLDSG